jgi:hypothetical protein
MAKKKVVPSLEALMDEFRQVSHGLWSEASRKKHRGDLDRFLAFLRRTGRPLTAEALDLGTLLAYLEELSTTPVARGVWRGGVPLNELAGFLAHSSTVPAESCPGLADRREHDGS